MKFSTRPTVLQKGNVRNSTTLLAQRCGRDSYTAIFQRHGYTQHQRLFKCRPHNLKSDGKAVRAQATGDGSGREAEHVHAAHEAGCSAPDRFILSSHTHDFVAYTRSNDGRCRRQEAIDLRPKLSKFDLQATPQTLGIDVIGRGQKSALVQ